MVARRKVAIVGIMSILIAAEKIVVFDAPEPQSLALLPLPLDTVISV